MRTGVGEAHVDRRVDRERVEVLGPVVGDDRRPPHIAFAVLDEHVQKGVQRVNAAFVGDLPEALTDQGRIGALDNGGVVEVAVPQRGAELLSVERGAEPTPILGVGQQLVALELVAKVQRGSACAELLEHGQIDAVGVQLERHGQMLEFHG